MEKQWGINSAEKQRQRESIAEQVRQFLNAGGSIDVLENTPPTQYRGSIWDNTNLKPPLD